MIKKILLLSLVVLSSCKKENYPFRLNEKYYSNPKLVELSSLEEYLQLEKEKDSFGVYVYLPGCISCSNFKPIVEEFIKTNNIQLYSISYTKIKNDNNQLSKNIEYAPSVALFSNGTLVTYLDTEKEEHIEYYKTVEGFSNWFTTYVEI